MTNPTHRASSPYAASKAMADSRECLDALFEMVRTLSTDIPALTGLDGRMRAVSSEMSLLESEYRLAIREALGPHPTGHAPGAGPAGEGQ